MRTTRSSSPLKTIGLVIGLWSIFKAIGLVIWLGAVAIPQIEHVSDYDSFPWLVPVFLAISYGVVAVLLFIGVDRENEKLLTPWIRFSLVILFVMLIFGLIQFAILVKETETEFETNWNTLILTALWSGLLFCELRAIYSLRSQIKQKKCTVDYNNLILNSFVQQQKMNKVQL